MLHMHKRPGDPEGFESLVGPLVDRLYAAALRLARSEADAEDLVQETLLRGYEAFPRLNPAGNLRAYLHRVLTNVYINRYRHRQVVATVAELAHLGLLDGTLYSSESTRVWSDPHVRFTHQNLSAAVDAALEALPERFRSVLVMADMMDFTYAEIAAQLSIPAGTVMSRLFRARRLMRAFLTEAEVADGRRLTTDREDPALPRAVGRGP